MVGDHTVFDTSLPTVLSQLATQNQLSAELFYQGKSKATFGFHMQCFEQYQFTLQQSNIDVVLFLQAAPLSEQDQNDLQQLIFTARDAGAMCCVLVFSDNEQLKRYQTCCASVKAKLALCPRVEPPVLSGLSLASGAYTALFGVKPTLPQALTLNPYETQTPTAHYGGNCNNLGSGYRNSATSLQVQVYRLTPSQIKQIQNGTHLLGGYVYE